MRTSDVILKMLSEERLSYQVIRQPGSLAAKKTVGRRQTEQCFAKTFIVKLGDLDAMFVVPADRRLDFSKISAELNESNVRPQTENEVSWLTQLEVKDAVPPFGALYEIPTYIDESLLRQKIIIFHAEKADLCVKMAMKDYLLIVNAQTGDYTVNRSPKPARRAYELQSQ